MFLVLISQQKFSVFPKQHTEGVIMSNTQNAIPMEHERRFFPPFSTELPVGIAEFAPQTEICQSYLEDAERTRIREEVCGEVRVYTRTRKVGSGISRSEDEMVIGRQEYLTLLEKATCSLKKMRHYLECDGIQFQFNTYREELDGYRQIEVEFGSHEEAVAFVPPEWFGKEVTDDSAHGNYSLAKNGIPRE